MSFDALKNTYKKLAENQELSDHNKQQLDDFILHMQGQNLAEATIARHLSSANQLSEHINFRLGDAGEKQVKNLVRKINTDTVTQQDGSDFGSSNKINCREFIKKFYSDFKGKPKLVDWLSIKPNSHDPKVDPDQLLNPDEILEIIKNSGSPRNKAVLWVLWDTGARVGGLFDTAYNKDEQILQWEDVKFKEDHVRITIRDKSWSQRGKSRTIPCKECMPQLRKLQEQENPDLSDPVFVKSQKAGVEKGPLTGDAVRRIIERSVEQTNISERKKVNPHAWRKARATFKASVGWNQAQLCEYFGWVQGSKEAAKYIRLAEQDLHKALAKEYDEEITEDFNEDLLKPVKCRECGTVCSTEWTYCNSCDSELDHELKMHNKGGDTVDLNLSAKVGLEAANNPEKSLNEIKNEILDEYGND